MSEKNIADVVSDYGDETSFKDDLITALEQIVIAINELNEEMKAVNIKLHPIAMNASKNYVEK